MNIQHLRYAVEVAKTGSITQAADNLYMGQPNLSKAIRDLEARLGIRIFRRTSRGAIPTLEGEEFLHYARGIIAQVEKVESLYRADHAVHVRFALGATHSGYVSEAFADFCMATARSFPGAKLSLCLHERARVAIVDAVADSECDAGVLRCHVDEEVALLSLLMHKELEMRALWAYQYGLMMSPRHPLAGEAAITREMLLPYPRIALDVHPLENLRVFEDESAISISEMNRVIVTGRDSAIALLNSMTDAYWPCTPVRAQTLARWGLVIRPIARGACRYRDLLIFRHGGMNGKLERLLLDALYGMQKHAGAQQPLGAAVAEGDASAVEGAVSRLPDGGRARYLKNGNEKGDNCDGHSL